MQLPRYSYVLSLAINISFKTRLYRSCKGMLISSQENAKFSFHYYLLSQLNKKKISTFLKIKQSKLKFIWHDINSKLE